MTLLVGCGIIILALTLFAAWGWVEAYRWRFLYMELLGKPFAFWEARERNRRIFEALGHRVK